MNKVRVVLIIICAFLICVALPFAQLRAANAKSKSSALLPNREAGFFSIFFSVLGVLYAYDKGDYSAVKIDFGKQGYYYSAKHGRNWWQYYFEPILLGNFNLKKIKILSVDSSIRAHDVIRDRISRKNVSVLIEKYVHLRPQVQQKIDSFIAENYKDYFVIGVHYRGTDKITEAPRIPYERMIGIVNTQVENLNGAPFKIFVATDEVAFLEFIKSVYGDKVCCIENASRSRSDSSVHKYALRNPYKVGEEAILDCVLLSKTNLLIRTSSNLSHASTFFNPDLPVFFVDLD